MKKFIILFLLGIILIIFVAFIIEWKILRDILNEMTLVYVVTSVSIYLLILKKREVVDVSDENIPIEKAIRFAKRKHFSRSDNYWMMIYQRSDFLSFINSTTKRKAVSIARCCDVYPIAEIVLDRPDITNKDIRRSKNLFDAKFFPCD